MIRNLKLLGLALAAVFALGAAVASVASAANGMLATDGPVTLIGTQTPAENPTENNRFTAFGGSTECPNATYTGHEVGTTELISNGATEVTLTPHYGSCTALGVPATVDMNGCDYVLQLESTTGKADEYFVGLGVICPENKHITLTLFTSPTKHVENKPFCHITITEKILNYNGLRATGTTNGHFDINGTASFISADKKSPTGSILCPEETTSLASFDTDLTVAGLNGQGEPTSIGLFHF